VPHNYPTQSRLKELFIYDPETGHFRYALARRGIKVGDVAGTPHSGGYIKMCVDRCYTFAHRLAWVYMTGELPTGDIDHINGIRTDNRFANLRHVSRMVNLQNRKSAGRNNKSTGILGAYPSFGGRFTSRIRLNKQDIYLGTFATAEEAHQRYLEAKRIAHEGCTI
jgi:hypothetical protein